MLHPKKMYHKKTENLSPEKKEVNKRYNQLDSEEIKDAPVTLQPQSLGEENSTNGIAQSSKAIINKGRPEGKTGEAQGRREMRTRDFKLGETWEGGWWQHKHPLCLKCAKECKQSDKVKIITCPQFKNLEEE